MFSNGSKVGIVALFIFGLCCLPHASALDPPQCIGYAYTTDDNHYFLLQNNSTMYGTTLIIKHNCDNMKVYLNSDIIHESNTNSTIYIPEGINNYTFILDNQTFQYSNVNVIDLNLGWLDQYQEYLDNQPSISANDSSKLVNWVAFFTGVIIWALSVNVYWRLINHYVDRNYFEEVT